MILHFNLYFSGSPKDQRYCCRVKLQPAVYIISSEFLDGNSIDGSGNLQKLLTNSNQLSNRRKEMAATKRQIFLFIVSVLIKVEKILKGILDLIPSPSPSVKIQIIVGKVCLRCKGKTLLGIVNKILLTMLSNVLPLHFK